MTTAVAPSPDALMRLARRDARLLNRHREYPGDRIPADETWVEHRYAELLAEHGLTKEEER